MKRVEQMLDALETRLARDMSARRRTLPRWSCR
jgi:hypothetical protein